MVPRHERGGSPEALRLDRGSPQKCPRVLEAGGGPGGERRGPEVPELDEPRHGFGRVASFRLVFVGLLGPLSEHLRELLLGFCEDRLVPGVVVEVAQDREPEVRGVRGGEAERSGARKRRRGRRRRTRRTSGRVDCRSNDESFSPSRLWPPAAFEEFDPHRGSNASRVMPSQVSLRRSSSRGSSSADGTVAHFFSRSRESESDDQELQRKKGKNARPAQHSSSSPRHLSARAFSSFFLRYVVRHDVAERGTADARVLEGR